MAMAVAISTGMVNCQSSKSDIRPRVLAPIALRTPISLVRRSTA